MVDADRAAADVDSRVAAITRGADLLVVADALVAARDQVLARWIEAARRQPFHREEPDRSVADHIPALFDALVDLLRRDADPDGGSTMPLDDPAVAAAATAHAQARFSQGLGPVAVVTEFRLLRQEVGRALRSRLDDGEAVGDVVAGLVIVSDALDGAATVGLSALSDRIETLRESFLATSLHDVRQPITLVEGSLGLAERWLKDPELDRKRLTDVVQDALAATAELTSIIDTLSDATRVAMGEIDPDPEPASLEAIVREAIGALGSVGRRRVMLEVPPGGHLIGLWDPGLLRRVVANLVGNALKYSPADRPVEVSIGPAGQTTCHLIVRDHGLGMTADELAGVFDRFARADRVRKAGISGLGLGLYACRGIVASHGGTIVVESDGQDRGTAVTVTLPTLSEVDLP